MDDKLYLSNRCNVCFHAGKKSSKILFKCSECSLILYCGEEHQMLDWNSHRDICTAVQMILEKEEILSKNVYEINGPIKSKFDLERAIRILKHLLNILMDRELWIYEQHLITFPRCCPFCFTFDIATTNNFICKECEVITYCSEEHKKLDELYHKKICSYLKIIYNLDTKKEIAIDWKFENTVSVDIVNGKHLFDVLRKVLDVSSVIKGDYEFFNIPRTPIDYYIYNALCSYSSVTTILFILHTCHIMDYLNDTLTIHIMSGNYEILNNFTVEHWKFLLFNIQLTIKKVKIFIISSRVTKVNLVRHSVSFRNSIFTIEIHYIKKQFYQVIDDIFKQNKLSKLPNLIVYLDVKPDINDTLQCTIARCLEIINTPILLTSYLKDDGRFIVNQFKIDALKYDKNLEMIMYCKSNPFKNYVPIRNYELYNSEEIYFSNNYLSVLLPQKCTPLLKFKSDESFINGLTKFLEQVHINIK